MAQINHPNIATLYGLEEHEGQRFLVMELAEGETLAERIAKGPIPVAKALPIALQIAEGLEAAHERGIVHRDLKPANIMLTPDEKAKVLDFGIATPLPVAASEEEARTRTLTRPPTKKGMLIGTPAYMSPEQVRGLGVDRRSDIWAFGVTLWEMLTGKQLFRGETDSDTLSAVLQASLDWQELPPETPAAVRRLFRRCIEEDPRDRVHDIADARIEIAEVISQPEQALTDEPAQPEATLWRKARAAWPAVLAAAVLSAVLATVLWKLFEIRLAAVSHSARVALNLPPDVTIQPSDRPRLAISPDGRWLVFAAMEGNERRLFKRSLDQFGATAIPGTEGGDQPFFSPDGRWVGFFADQKLKKISLAGGPPQIIAEASNPWGATWGQEGEIVFCPDDDLGLWRVRDSGGPPEHLISPRSKQGTGEPCWPEFLPDSEAVLFTDVRGITADTARICVLELESGATKTLIDNASYARYLPTGHLVFGQEGAVYVTPFDATRREVTGPSVPVPEPIFYDMDNGVPDLAFSSGGTLAFIRGGSSPKRRLVSVDMEGRETPLVEAQRGFMYPKFSPDGKRLAVTISEPGDTNVWVLNLTTGAQTRLTQEGANVFPLWTPDGQRVTYLSHRGESKVSIDWKRADGHGESEPLISAEEVGELLAPGSWSPDGETLAYLKFSAPFSEKGGGDIWTTTRDGDPEPRPLVATGSHEYGPAISPDGQRLAYASEESGRREVYVQPFPDGGQRHQISTGVGHKPVWSPDGTIIYYRELEDGPILAASVTTKPRFEAEAPRMLLEGKYEEGLYTWAPNFDIAPDGESFVMIKEDEDWGRATEIRVVLNWFEEIERLVPTE
jgi:serine/threonine-protein kinase